MDMWIDPNTGIDAETRLHIDILGSRLGVSHAPRKKEIPLSNPPESQLYLMSQRVEVSLIVPCYNEEEHLVESVFRIKALFRNHQIKYEILFVDDLSTDRTPEIIQEIVDRDAFCRAIYHKKNMGRGKSFMDGVRVAKGNIVGFLDIDLEVSENYIPAMLDAVRQGADVATGCRKIKLSFEPYHLLRHVLSIGYRILYRTLLRLSTQDPETGCKFFRREKLLQLMDFAKNPGWFWDSESMAYSSWLGFDIVEIPCLFVRRSDKKSSIRVLDYTARQARELSVFVKRVRQEKWKNS